MARKTRIPKVAPSVFRLRIAIRRIRPPIWRRVQVPGTLSLAGFHEVIQTLFGWTDTHLHWFRIGGKSFGQPDDFDEAVADEDSITLARALGERVRRFSYVYDFGDDWVHDIVVEKVASNSGFDRPLCLAGRRRRPPEDCGGPLGYERLLAALRNPRPREHAELRESVGGRFDPEAFDLAAVNGALAALSAGQWRIQ